MMPEGIDDFGIGKYIENHTKLGEKPVKILSGQLWPEQARLQRLFIPKTAGDLLNNETEFSDVPADDTYGQIKQLYEDARSIARAIAQSDDVLSIEGIKLLTGQFKFSEANKPPETINEAISRALSIVAMHHTLKMSKLHPAEVEYLPPEARSYLDGIESGEKVIALIESISENIPALELPMDKIITGRSEGDGKDWNFEEETKKLIEGKFGEQGVGAVNFRGFAQILDTVRSYPKFFANEGLVETEVPQLDNDKYKLTVSRMMRLFSWMSYLDKDMEIDSWEGARKAFEDRLLQGLEENDRDLYKHELDLVEKDMFE
ncbi:hypothetical protein KBC75_04020 [Candidatus Shapirobacteria bacterium]|nr:hypothetical protein [Candidatus Shapirobacteria bacterium]